MLPRMCAGMGRGRLHNPLLRLCPRVRITTQQHGHLCTHPAWLVDLTGTTATHMAVGLAPLLALALALRLAVMVSVVAVARALLLRQPPVSRLLVVVVVVLVVAVVVSQITHLVARLPRTAIVRRLEPRLQVGNIGWFEREAACGTFVQQSTEF